MDLVEVLGFIFMLSTMELGRVIPFFLWVVIKSFSYLITQEYSTENLSGTQKAMLEDLRDYGLIWQRKVCSWNFPLSYCFSVPRLAHLTAFQPHSPGDYIDIFFSTPSHLYRR